jgi:hypothetical protein
LRLVNAMVIGCMVGTRLTPGETCTLYLTRK